MRVLAGAPISLLALAVTACGGGGSGGSTRPEAIDIVREAYAVIGQLGSAAISLSQRFQTGGELRQLASLGPGTVAPNPVSCPNAGGAMVSGELQAAGTFTAGDALSAEFDTCTNPGEVLDGLADLTMLDWQSTGGFGFTYTATFTATLTDLRRESGGVPAMTANGTLTHTLDGLTESGKLLLSVTSEAFELADAAGTRTLVNAQNAATFSSTGPGAPLFESSASGELASSVLGRGTYAYETLAPLQSVSDNDPATGPQSGALKVTTPDGGSVTLVAVDNVNVRLEIDSDGDGTVDETQDWTWADVQ